MTDGRTHWEGCWREHRDCAVAEVEELRALLREAQNALLDYVERLEKQGGMMNYGRSVLARIDAAMGEKND